MSGPLYAMALTVPWQITSEALDAILSIAADDPLPTEEIKRRMHGPHSLALRDGQRREDSRRMTMRDGVAVIPIDGPIHRYANFFTNISGGVTTQGLARDFGIALQDPAVEAIMFVLDSPGGEVQGLGELADAIYEARGTKPIAAYVEGLGASAAYRIASACDEIIIESSALIGSIGTVMGIPDPAKMVTRSIEFVSTQSPKKRPDPTSEVGKTYLQKLVDDMTEVFIGQVMRDRGLSREQVLAVEGGMLVGQYAVDAGLADRLGTEESTLQELKVRAAALAAQRNAPQGAHKEATIMKISEIFGGFLKAAQDSGMPIEPDDLPQQTTTPAPSQQQPAPHVDQAAQQQIAELQRRLVQAETARIQQDAAAFVQAQLASGHAYPAEQQALGQLYAQLAQDDAAHPLQAADGQVTSRVALLKGAIESRPGHQLAREVVQGRLPKGSQALPAAQASKEAQLLQDADQQGRAYAAEMNKRK